MPAPLEKMSVVCDHCSAMEKVLTNLVGPKVSRVIMKRVENELHGEFDTPKAGTLAPQMAVEPTPLSRNLPKGYVV